MDLCLDIKITAFKNLFFGQNSALFCIEVWSSKSFQLIGSTWITQMAYIEFKTAIFAVFLYCQFLSNVNQMHIHWRVWQVSESIKGAPAEYNTNSVVWGDVNRQAEKAWRGDAESPSLPGNHSYMSNPTFSHSRELNAASWWTLWEGYPITPCWGACLSTW